MSFLRFPRDGWQQIERAVTSNPKLLKADHYHTLANGEEALTEDQILLPATAHCLFGWVVAITPRGPEYEGHHSTFDVVEFANTILQWAGEKPLPTLLAYEDEDTYLKIIGMRAADERVRTQSSLRNFTVN